MQTYAKKIDIKWACPNCGARMVATKGFTTPVHCCPQCGCSIDGPVTCVDERDCCPNCGQTLDKDGECPHCGYCFGSDFE